VDFLWSFSIRSSNSWLSRGLRLAANQFLMPAKECVWFEDQHDLDGDACVHPCGLVNLVGQDCQDYSSGIGNPLGRLSFAL
jgi:hypothetical protein